MSLNSSSKYQDIIELDSDPAPTLIAAPMVPYEPRNVLPAHEGTFKVQDEALYAAAGPSPIEEHIISFAPLPGRECYEVQTAFFHRLNRSGFLRSRDEFGDRIYAATAGMELHELLDGRPEADIVHILALEQANNFVLSMPMFDHGIEKLVVTMPEMEQKTEFKTEEEKAGYEAGLAEAIEMVEEANEVLAGFRDRWAYMNFFDILDDIRSFYGEGMDCLGNPVRQMVFKALSDTMNGMFKFGTLEKSTLVRIGNTVHRFDFRVARKWKLQDEPLVIPINTPYLTHHQSGRFYVDLRLFIDINALCPPDKQDELWRYVALASTIAMLTSPHRPNPLPAYSLWRDTLCRAANGGQSALDMMMFAQQREDEIDLGDLDF